MEKTNIATRDNHSKLAILLFNKWFRFQRNKTLNNLNTCIFACCNLNNITTSSMMHPNLWNSCIDSSMILSEQVESSKHGGKCLTCGNWPGAKLSMAGAGAAGVARPALRSGASTACLASGAQTEGSIRACLHEEGKQHQRVEGKKSKMRVPWGAEQSRSTIN